MFVGIGVGIGRQRFGSGIFSAYDARVVADGGVTEAGSCVNAVSALLQSASLLLVPSGYKSGKVYAEIPTNGNGDLTFTRASTAVRTNSTGLLESMTTGVPRLSYMYGSCPALLLEPQRTNLVLQSEDFSSASWLKLGGSSVTANTTTSPDGNSTADTLSLTTNASSSVAQAIVFATTTTITISVYAKVASGTKNFRLRTDNPTTTQSFTATTSWQRFSMTATPVGSTSAYVINDLAGTAGDLIIWGFQVEVGAYATTYIPTTTATVTRIADAANKTGISSLIGQSEGVLFWEGIVLNITDIVAINRSTANGIYINKGAGNLFRTSIYNSSNIIQFADTIVRNTNTKIAIAYKSGDSAMFVNGSKIGATNTSTITFSGALSEIRLNDNYLIETAPQFTNKLAIYNTRLTDAECQTLTTL
jgi:hypothetical protein